MLVAYIAESEHSRDPKSHFGGVGGLIADSADFSRNYSRNVGFANVIS